MLMIGYCSESHIVLIKYTHKSVFVYIQITFYYFLFYVECDVHKANDDYSWRNVCITSYNDWFKKENNKNDHIYN